MKIVNWINSRKSASCLPDLVIVFSRVTQVYWSDVADSVIYRTRPEAGYSAEPEVFLNASHGIGVVDGKYIRYY